MFERFLTVNQGAEFLKAGKVVAYPTEAVYGLGCDPSSESAVQGVLALKKRDPGAGLILIADKFERFLPYVHAVKPAQMKRAMDSWPGPVTWLFPRAGHVADWLAGHHPTIAVRVSAHPVCRALCAAFEGPVVSSSANPSTAPPATDAMEVADYFGDGIAGIVEGQLGDEISPSEIRDVVSGEVIREN